MSDISAAARFVAGLRRVLPALRAFLALSLAALAESVIRSGNTSGVGLALYLLAIALFAWGAIALRGFDFFGLAPIQAWLRGTAEKPPIFVVRGPYRWVRHPFYLSVLVLIWSCPDLTTDRLLFNLLWTAWVILGTTFEEADLQSDFGEPYSDYRRRVPMLIPWRGRVTL
jgi:protein-S-isoprenylcysteine O-methyltransferase Ste14